MALRMSRYTHGDNSLILFRISGKIFSFQKRFIQGFYLSESITREKTGSLRQFTGDFYCYLKSVLSHFVLEMLKIKFTKCEMNPWSDTSELYMNAN